MIAGIMIVIYALMFLGLGVSTYSAISRRREERQSRSPRCQPEYRDPDGEQQISGCLGAAHSERNSA